MKKWIIAGGILLLGIVWSMKSQAQTQEIAQLLLNVEKLAQFKSILQNMYDGYKTLSDGYNKVRDVASGNFKLHQLFLDGLYAVSPEVRKYWRVADIIDMQLKVLEEKRKALAMFRSADIFSAGNMEVLEKTLGKLSSGSLDELEELILILTGGETRMSDAERLEIIDRLHERMQGRLVALRRFVTETRLLAVQLTREQSEISTLKQQRGIE